jgi:hypothetical protein
MVYDTPATDEPIDQGDIVDGCPIFGIANFESDDLDAGNPERLEIEGAFCRVLIVTQTCDFANKKASMATVALVRDADELVRQGLLKSAEVRGPIRCGRVYGWYFLPRSDMHGCPESIVDLRQLHTIRLDLLTELCRRGKRPARVRSPFREHLAKHLADTYSRIGLPEPYQTD